MLRWQTNWSQQFTGTRAYKLHPARLALLSDAALILLNRSGLFYASDRWLWTCSTAHLLISSFGYVEYRFDIAALRRNDCCYVRISNSERPSATLFHSQSYTIQFSITSHIRYHLVVNEDLEPTRRSKFSGRGTKSLRLTADDSSGSRSRWRTSTILQRGCKQPTWARSTESRRIRLFVG